MHSFRWLHFSDLHVGADGTRTLWPEFRDDLEKDLRRIHGYTKGWDVVILTGDIVYSAHEDQFKQATESLVRLWEFFKTELGCAPPIICVPGNHDLQRPDPDASTTKVLSKLYWDDNEGVRKRFWEDPDNEHRRLVDDCFRNYADWFAALPLPKPVMRSGILPGDISATVKNELQVGFVGLNSAFLHVSDLRGGAGPVLDLHEKQFFEVCDADPPGWCEANDLNFILTHHGQDWLQKRALDRFRREIYDPAKFYAHLFGHMHTPATIDISQGGNLFRRFRQAPSLFGLEKYGQKKESRCHGYTAGMIRLSDEEIKENRWTRHAAPREDGRVLLGPEPRSDLDEESVVTIFRIKLGRSEDETFSPPVGEGGPIIPQMIRQIRKEIFRAHNYIERLEKIENAVSDLWRDHHGPPWEIFHNELHNIEVEKALYQLIPEGKRNALKDEEWYALIAAAWLHDIGMIVELPGFENGWLCDLGDRHKETHYMDIRRQHHLRSASYVRKNLGTFGIDEREAEGIAMICKFHRGSEDINACTENIGGNRIALLAAYLRLALTIHLDKRVAPKKYQELLQTTGMDWESMFHWMKAQWVVDIKADPERQQLTLIYLDAPAESDTAGFVPERIGNELKDVLHSILIILVRGRISCFLDVNMQKHGFIDASALRELELIQSNIRLEELSSASEAYETVLNTLLKFTAYPDPLKLITSYVSNINRLLALRPCHNMIRNLSEQIEPIITSDRAIAGTAVTDLRKIVRDLIERRRKKNRAMRMNARPFLTDRGSILLYGYSTSILEALKSLSPEDKKHTKVYIGECRGKSQFDRTNQILYNDGLNYAQKVKELGYTQVQIIPDISIGNLMKRNRIQKVFFGANGIDRQTGSFGHTCGHLSIADLSKEYHVPVYVIADTEKFGQLKWEEDLNRDINWLTNDPKWLPAACEMAKENPREDQVEPDKIHTLITEIGAFPPARIPDRIKEASKEDKGAPS